MAASQPDFMAEYRSGSVEAHNATCSDGVGNSTHTAVKHWGRFMVKGLHVNMVRPFDSTTTSLAVKLGELDFVEAFAWWLVKHVGTNTETAWSYVCVVNAWHHRAVGVYLAANFPLDRIKNMLSGMQRLSGVPVPRLKRIGVRPQRLWQAMRGAYQDHTKLQANYATALQVGLVALARAGELVSGLPRGQVDFKRHPSRKHVQFKYNSEGKPVGCTLWIVNSKAKGAESLRRLPVPLPMTGTYLSPGQALWDLIHVIDPVPADQFATTPLFRIPSTNKILTVTQLRNEIRFLMSSLGLDGSLYGAHSLRIGGATALAFLGALPEQIKAHGRWKSDAYMRYVRERERQCIFYTSGICGADVDDFEADHLDFEADQLDETDMQ